MQAHPMSISDVIGGQKQYVVPVFQRTYEWGKDRWESLWNDITTIADERDMDFTHFIGPMVVISKAYPHDVPQHLVIDGQQRLMTLTVLLAAIRDRARNLKLDALADAIESNTLFFLNTKGQRVKKIIPRLRDRDALENILNSHTSESDPNLLINQARQYFYSEIEKLTPVQPTLFDEKPELYLDRIYKAVAQRLKVVMISLEKGDDPSNIYESLNFKQETLKDAALIRNYVFMKLPELEDQEAFDNAYWKAFEELFSFHSDPGQLLTDFYYRFLISKKGYMARKRLYTSFTKYVDEFLQTSTLEQLVSELKKFSLYFIAIVRACDDKELEAAFSRFRLLETDTAIPLVLALYDKYASTASDQKVNKTSFLQMLRIIESFILRRLILRMRTRGYGEDFAIAVGRTGSVNDLREYFDGRGWPSNDEIQTALKEFEFYLRAPKQCRMVLVEIERSFGHKERVDLSDKGVQIEHVMPQNLTQSWRDMLGTKAEEIHENLLHTLGNLTLTGYNLELGDRPFEEKKTEYRKSKISLNKYFEKHSVWAEKEILERTSALCSRFTDLWGGPDQIKPGTGTGKQVLPKR